MGKRDTEKRYANAVKNAVPDVFDSILPRCETTKGTVIKMNEKTKKRSFLKPLIAVAAAAAIIIGATFAFGAMNGKMTIGIDVNPSIQLTVNSSEKVTAVEALNGDAVIILGDMQLKGASLDVAINALVGSMLKNGYIDEIKNSIMLSVDGSDAAAADALEQKLVSEIDACLSEANISAAILSQTVSADSEIQKLADTYGISVGKATLITEIITQKPQHTFDSLVGLTINELNLLLGDTTEVIHSSGAASDKGYIGKDRAREIAVADAGFAVSQVTFEESGLDYENGKMLYEVEFWANGAEYDYDVDATTGEIVKKTSHAQAKPDIDNDDDYVDPNASYIGIARAREIAIANAGFTLDRVTVENVELDSENGRVVYEVEFWANGAEYDYEIDAASGEIVRSSSSPELTPDIDDDDDDRYDDDDDDRYDDDDDDRYDDDDDDRYDDDDN